MFLYDQLDFHWGKISTCEVGFAGDTCPDK